MSHESDNTLIDGSLDIRLVIQNSGKCLCITLLCHQWSTYYDIQVETLHICIGEVTIAVVHEVLDIRVTNTAILLTRDHLQ